ncbi:para-nitrobenzyl esterase [soil metagenome]
MKLIFRGIACFVVAIASLTLHAKSDNDSPVLRKTSYGPVQGVDDASGTGTFYWKGVPFAKPPTGALRWKAPVEPDAWTGTRNANAFGNACVQSGRMYGPGANNRYDETIATTLNKAVGSEDCLTLNIWRPANAQTRLPVILFIYGGSHISGYSADPIYDGAKLARTANAVVVTANYRLGIFGWFGLAQLKEGNNALDDSGNFGTLDNLQALKFIKRNIENFGGDPDNVTLIGESAGAINVYALMVSPLVVNAKEKLFHKAIPLSGGISLSKDLPPGSSPLLLSTESMLAQGEALLNAALIADGKASDADAAKAYVAAQTKTQIADYMRSKDPGALLDILATKVNAGQRRSSPIHDGVVVSKDPIASIAAGDYMKVPVWASNTRDEGKLFGSFFVLFGGPPGLIGDEATRFMRMKNFNPDAEGSLKLEAVVNDAYLPVNKPASGYNAKSELLSSIIFLRSRDSVLNALKAQQPKVWHSQFNWDKEASPWNEVFGAAHFFEMPFIFGNFGPSLISNVIGGTANEKGRLALSNAMMNTVGAFARNGDPNNASLGVKWAPWPKKLFFDATLSETNISAE